MRVSSEREMPGTNGFFNLAEKDIRATNGWKLKSDEITLEI